MRKKGNSLKLVDAPLFSYWQALYMSFYSKSLYVDVVKRWQGLGVLYLLLVIALVMIPVSARMMIDFNRYFDAHVLEPLKMLPPLVIQNGKVQFDEPMPYYVKNSDMQITAIIDTTGHIKELSEAYPDATFLVTKTKLFFRPPLSPISAHFGKKLSQQTVSSQSFGNNTNEMFVGKEWVNARGLYMLKWVSIAMVYPVVAVLIYSMYVVFLLLFAFIGLLFSIIIFQFKMGFQQACRVFLVAATPQVCLFVTFLTLNIQIPNIGILYVILLSLYYSYAIIALKREGTRLVHQ